MAYIRDKYVQWCSLLVNGKSIVAGNVLVDVERPEFGITSDSGVQLWCDSGAVDVIGLDVEVNAVDGAVDVADVHVVDDDVFRRAGSECWSSRDLQVGFQVVVDDDVFSLLTDLVDDDVVSVAGSECWGSRDEGSKEGRDGDGG